MAAFQIRLGTPDGNIAVRTIEAPDEATARSEVARQGGRVFSIKAASAGAAARGRDGFASLLPGRRGIGVQEFLIFNQELVALLHAGLPIVSGFDILIERQENARFKRILGEIRDQLVSGVALSDAFLAHGDEFPRLYATSLKAGERSGEVEGVLRRFLQYQKLLGSVRRKVTGALVYPMVLVGLSVGLVLVLMTYVIPKFTEFYAGFEAGDLPIITQVVVGTANFMKAHILEVFLGIVAAFFVFRRWKKTPRGALLWDTFLLKLPLVGTILHQFALSQFSRALATLVGAGRRWSRRSRSPPARSRTAGSPTPSPRSCRRCARVPSSGGASRTRGSSPRWRSR
jgi:type IV pilus assembly protein PilC